MPELILREKFGGVLTITLNRPEAFNALTSNLLMAIKEGIEEAEEDGDTGVIILTGRGKAFCAGGDLDEILGLSESSLEKRREYLLRFLGVIDAIRGIGKPVIAAVNGYCIGGGNEINIACDLTVAAEHAMLGQAGVKVGSAPLLGGTQFLPLVMGEKRAKEMVYLCNPLSAGEALEAGLVNRVVPAEELMDESLRIADELLAMSPSALAMAKKSHNGTYRTLRPSMEEGVEMLAAFWGTEEAREGLKAFKEKRKANFREHGSEE